MNATPALYQIATTRNPLICADLCNCCIVVNMPLVPGTGVENGLKPRFFRPIGDFLEPDSQAMGGPSGPVW